MTTAETTEQLLRGWFAPPGMADTCPPITSFTNGDGATVVVVGDWWDSTFGFSYSVAGAQWVKSARYATATLAKEAIDTLIGAE